MPCVCSTKIEDQPKPLTSHSGNRSPPRLGNNLMRQQVSLGCKISESRRPGILSVADQGEKLIDAELLAFYREKTLRMALSRDQRQLELTTYS